MIPSHFITMLAIVMINGGTITATGRTGISARYDITLGWTKPTDSITASSYYAVGGVRVKTAYSRLAAAQTLEELTARYREMSAELRRMAAGIKQRKGWS